MIKKCIFLIIAVAFFSFCHSASASPVSGTHPIIDGSLVALGTEYDYVYGRDLDASNATRDTIVEQNTFYVKMTFKAADFLFIYPKLGIANFKTESQLDNGKLLDEEYDTGFYGGCGAKFLYEFFPRVNAALDTQLDWWNCAISTVAYDDVEMTQDIDKGASAWDFQIAGIVSYTIDYDALFNLVHGEFPALIPYVGIKYAYLRIDSDVVARSGNITAPIPDSRKNENSLGIIVGLDINFISLKGFDFNIEGRFLDESAISGYMNYSF